MSTNNPSADRQAFARLDGRTVLVTGGTGFIGGRLLELIARESQAWSRALVRDVSRPGRLSALVGKVELVPGALGDPVAVERAVAGCAIVFHCAYDVRNPAENLSGLRHLIAACVRHRSRLVLVSSFAVYQPYPDGDLSEALKPAGRGGPYSAIKLKLETAVFAAVAEQGLDAVVVLPTIVYGPHGGVWTVGPAWQVSSGTVVLPGQGDGLCNAVFVDDVCQALVLAATTPAARGQRYLVSGAAPVTWKEYFEAYARILKRPGPQCRPDLQARVAQPRLDRAKRVVQRGGQVISRVIARLPSGLAAPLRRLEAMVAPVHLPDEVRLSLYRSKCRVQIAKAATELSYRPDHDLDRGMTVTSEWLRAGITLK